MVIIGLLAAYVGPRYFGQVGKSERALARTQIESFSRALDAYRLDMGHFPSSEEGLQSLVNRPAGQPRWNGPYLTKDIPLDPWQHAYVYRTPGKRGDYDLLSYGNDGQPGGVGDAADITNTD